jgi:DNA topoisomerase-1
LGDHPDGGDVKILDGRFGPYIKYKKLNATLPKTADPLQISLEDGLALLLAKAEKDGQKPAKAKAKTKAKPKAKTKPKARAKTGKATAAAREVVAGSSD